MANKYDTSEREQHWQKFWLENQIYTFDKNDTIKPVYSIDTPPPTVSGKLHIGHIFSYTQAEVMARYKRMKGFNVFYPMGYDDNGIPTEQLVEKETGINVKETPRKDFVEKCMEVDEKYKKLFTELWQRMGLSIDRTRTYTTINPEVQKISQKEFVKLYKKGHIVAKMFPALRCPVLQATIAQAETEQKEFDEFFNDLKFTLEDGSDLIIATTRPELLPACLAVLVHPEDERYQKYIGKTVKTPLGITVPIIADNKVKMDKGTGALMCCSYGDEEDVLWINKYNLTPKIIVDRYGKIFDSGVQEIDGLKTSQAREKIMEILSEGGFVLKRTPIVQSKAVSERGKVPVEIIPVHQRFVVLLDKKEALKGQNDKMNWFPEFMKKRSEERIDNLHRDRNISRARKFGIPIPVRYSKKTGEVILPTDAQLENGVIDPTSQMPESLPAGHTAEDIRPEEMVLDTRFTSGITPLINQKFLERDGGKQNLLPFSLRPQAHDIIRTRLLYTTLHAYLRDESIPFKDVMISGHVLAGKGEKISKSKGNAKYEPVDLINQRGADAIRFRSLGGQLGKDMVFEEAELKNGQKLVTKLRNAFQFVKMQLADLEIQRSKDLKIEGLYPTDQRILMRLNETIGEMTKYLEMYEYGLAKTKFEEFFWRDFCDNYLEIVKLRLYKPELFQDGIQKKLSGQKTLYYVFYSIIRLIAPYVPHITEEIYQDYFKTYEGTESVHLTSYPVSDIEVLRNGGMEELLMEFNKLLVVIEDVRKYKTDKQISLGAELEKLIISGKAEYLNIFKKFEDDLRGVTKAKSIEYAEGEEGVRIE